MRQRSRIDDCPRRCGKAFAPSWLPCPVFGERTLRFRQPNLLGRLGVAKMPTAG